MDLNNNFITDVFHFYTNMNANTFVDLRTTTHLQWNGYFCDVWFTLRNDDL